jgi:hypothetical protein
VSEPVIRNRIKGPRRVRASDLVPHEWNFRTHPEMQRAALEALYTQVGPDMEVEVEVLDVNEDEAKTLLLSIDLLAELAEAQEQLRGRLMELAPADSEELRAAWQAVAEGALKEEKERPSFDSNPEQFLLLVTCRDEQQQVELLQRFHDEGIQVKALIS